MNKNYKD